MNTNPIPLPDAIIGKEYIISHINNNVLPANTLKGYGIFRGSKIKLLFASPSGNPCAYEVMGAVLALRHEDSRYIFISPAALQS